MLFLLLVLLPVLPYIFEVLLVLLAQLLDLPLGLLVLVAEGEKFVQVLP